MVLVPDVVAVEVVAILESSLEGVVSADVVVVESAVALPVFNDMVLAADNVVNVVVDVDDEGGHNNAFPNVTMDGKRTVMVGSGFNMGVFSSVLLLLLLF